VPLGPEPTENQIVEDEMILSQHGKVGEPFQNSLRPRRHRDGLADDESLILGEASVEEATDQRYVGPVKQDYSRCRVRESAYLRGCRRNRARQKNSHRERPWRSRVLCRRGGTSSRTPPPVEITARRAILAA
jgi:hypothetical protein